MDAKDALRRGILLLLVSLSVLLAGCAAEDEGEDDTAGDAGDETADDGMYATHGAHSPVGDDATYAPIDVRLKDA